MPAIFAHHLFGHRVAKALPPDLQKLLAAFPEAFKIGLQGPDFLFFYHPLQNNRVQSIGNEIHQRPMQEFAQEAADVLRERDLSCAEYAYFIGFVCHFLLDSACHPYVAQAQENEAFAHILMESEFDRFLLAQEGKTAAYPLHKLVPKKQRVTTAMTPFYTQYEGVDADAIGAALHSMYFYKRLLYCPNCAKQAFLQTAMRLLGISAMAEHLIINEPNPKGTITNPQLLQRFMAAQENAVPLLAQMHMQLQQKNTAFLQTQPFVSLFAKNFE